MEFSASGRILEVLEAADASVRGHRASPRKARRHHSRMAKLEHKNKASYDQIVGNY
jgi:hypothetical protein